MMPTSLDCSALVNALELSSVDAEPDLAAIDLHLARCAKCRADHPEVAYLRGLRDPIAAGSHSPRVLRFHGIEGARILRPTRALAAAAVLIFCTFALDRSRQRVFHPISPPAPDQTSIARVGRVRILPSHLSSVTTTVASSTGTRNSTTRRTIALDPRTN